MRLTRFDQLDRLAGPTARTIAWWQLALGGAAALTLLELIGRRPPGADVEQLIVGLRFAMLAVALSATFVLDDPTEDTVCAVPLPLALRRGLRIAVALPMLTAVWIGLVAYAHADPQLVEPLPVAELTLELAALVAVVFAVAALSSGVAAGPVLLVVVVLAAFVLPPWARLYTSHTDVAVWSSAHQRWELLLVVALATLSVANRDPGRPSPRMRFGRTVMSGSRKPLPAAFEREAKR